MTTAAQLMVKVGADISEATNGLRNVNEHINGLASTAASKLNAVGEGFTNVGRKVTMMSVPVAAGMGVAIAKAAEFESQMNVLDITMRESGVTGEQWSQVALKIGADSELVGISASGAADAITNFGKAGLDVNQILGDYQSYLQGSTSLTGALRAAIDLAAASGMNLDAASQGVVQTMNQYGLSFDQAGTVMDNFVRTADASTASVEQLLQAQENVGPVMAQMGFSVEQANVQLAMLHDRGIMGAEAGTALKAMWLHMTNPATKAGEALAALNVNLYDVSGNMRNSKDIIADLSKALDENATMTYAVGGATKDQAKELVSYESKIRSTRAALEEYAAGARGAGQSEAQRAKKLAELNNKLALYEGKHRDLMQSIPGVTAKTVAMNDATRNAALQAIAGAYGIKALNIMVDEGAIGWDEYEQAISGATSMQEQAAARTQGFQAAMEQFKSVVESFMITAALPFIRDFLTPFLRKAGEVLQKIMDVHPGFAKWAMALGAIIVIAGPILMFIGSLITAISTIASVVGAVGGIIGGVVAAIAGALGPILLVIGAIIAIVVALRAAWESNFLGIRDALQPFVDAVAQAWAYIKTIFTNFGRFLRGEISWQEFLDRAKAALEGAGRWIMTAFERLKEGIIQIWENIKAAILQKLAEFLAPLLGGTEAAKEKIIQAWEFVKQVLIGTWNNLVTAATTAWEFIKGVIAAAVEAIRGIIAFFVQVLSGDWEGAWNTIKTTVLTVWENIKTGISNALGVIAPAIKNAWEGIKTAVSEKLEAIKTAAIEKWEQIKTGVAQKVEALRAAVGDKIDTIKTGLAEKWEAIKSGAVEKWEAVKERISTIVTTIKDFVIETLGGLVEKAIELFGKLLGALTGGGGEGPSFDIDFGALIAALTGLRDEWTATQEHIIATLATIRQATDAWLSTARSTIMSTWEAILSFLRTTWDQTLATYTTFLANSLAALTAHLQQSQALIVTIWTAIRAWLNATWNSLLAEYTTFLANSLAALTLHLQQSQTIIVTIWTAIQQFLYTTWAAIQAQLAAILAAMLANIQQQTAAMLSDFTAKWNNILTTVTTLASAMRDRVVSIVNDMANQIRAILEGLQAVAHDSGVAMGEAMAAGIIDSIPTTEDAARQMAEAIMRWFPFSDAKVGPLSHITASGAAFVTTFAGGIRSNVGEMSRVGEEVAQALQTGLGENIDTSSLDVFRALGDVGEALKVLARGPAGDVRQSLEAWKQQITYVIRMLAEVWRNWQDKAVFEEAKKAAEVISAAFAPWETVRKAIAALIAGPGGDVRDMLEVWKQQVTHVIRMLAQIWRNWQDKAVFEEAKQAAEAIGAAFAPWEDLKEAMAAIIAGPGGDVRHTLAAWRAQIAAVFDMLIGLAKEYLAGSATAANIAEVLGDIIGNLVATLNSLNDLENVQEAGMTIGEQWINSIVNGIMQSLPKLTQAVGAAIALLGGAAIKPPAFGGPPIRPFGRALQPAVMQPPDSPAAAQPGQPITINIYNPTGQPTEESIISTLRKLAAVGLLEPV